MSDEIKYLRKSQRGARQPVLMGLKLSRDWLERHQETVLEVRFGDALREAVADLEELAQQNRETRKNLPTRTLRTALRFELECVIRVESELGSTDRAAFTLLADSEVDIVALREKVAALVRRWVQDAVDPWATYNEVPVDDVVARIETAIAPEQVEVTERTNSLVSDQGRLDYDLLAAVLAERLDGETLFEDCSPCLRVNRPDSRGGCVIELMTPQQHLTVDTTRTLAPDNTEKVSRRGRDELYSMAARIAVVQLPFSGGDVYLTINAQRRVWANREPESKSWGQRGASAYVHAPGKPITEITIRPNTDNVWEFQDDYVPFQRLAGDALPQTVKDAVARRHCAEPNEWWVGIAQTTHLYNRMDNRTVYEGDEKILVDGVRAALKPILDPAGVPYRAVRMTRLKQPIKQPIVKRDRLGEYDVQSHLFELLDDTDERPDASVPKDLIAFREQNRRAIRAIHGNQALNLWLYGGTEHEQGLVAAAARELFEDAVVVHRQPLPNKVHGLKQDLPCANDKPAVRFESRVKAWAAETTLVRERMDDAPLAVVVCAPDFVGSKPEDRVNMHAGIHAWSAAGANVQYLLPINEGKREDRRLEDFTQRAQSAIRDVLLGHRGVMFNASDAVARIFSEEQAEQRPDRVFGIQYVRSLERFRSGEQRVQFALFSCLEIKTGTVTLRYVCQDGKRFKASTWMPLHQALQWLGSQRVLGDSARSWNRDQFQEVVRDQLIELQDRGGKAVVVIDWSGTRNLLTGIRDSDLNGPHLPSIGSTPLSAFPDMTYIRLRRDATNTMKLRTQVSEAFEVADNSHDEGADKTVTYLTTAKQIVEVSSLQGDAIGCGHFISSWGYPSTNQSLRGFSCYRTTTRMQPCSDSVFYKESLLTPPTKEGTLPAPTELTVLQAQPGVDPQQYAILINALRAGHAHYAEATGLPAPLFYERKVHDYIIRFPETPDIDFPIDEERRRQRDEEDAEAAGGHEVQPYDVSTEAPCIEQIRVSPTHHALKGLSMAVRSASGANNTRPIVSSDVMRRIAPATPAVLAKGETITTAAAPAEITAEDATGTAPTNDVVQTTVGLADKELGKQVPYFLFTSSSQYLELFTRMIARKTHVRVAVPPFARDAKIVFQTNLTRRMVRAGIGMLKQKRYPLPVERSANGLVNMFHDWLDIPQAVVAINSLKRELGLFSFEPLVEILQSEFIPVMRDENPNLKVSTFGYDRTIMAELARYAIRTDHDALAAWLLFLVAQFPEPTWREVIEPTLADMGGPMVREAKLYLDTCKKAFQHATRGWAREKDHYKGCRLDLYSAGPNQAKVEAPLDETVAARENIIPSDESPTLVRLASLIVPGGPDFNANVSQLTNELDRLVADHSKIISRRKQEAEAERAREVEARWQAAEQARLQEEQRKAEEERRQREENARKRRLAERRAAQRQIIEAYEPLRELGELPVLQVVETDDDCHNAVISAAATMEGPLQRLTDAVAALSALETQPEPASLLERRAQTEEKNAAFDAVLKAREDVLAAVRDAGSAFAADGISAPLGTATERERELAPAAPAVEPVRKDDSLKVDAAPDGEFNEESKSDAEEDEALVSEKVDFDTVMDVLCRLTETRLYGLANVQAYALKRHLQEIDDDDTAAHMPLVGGLVRVLEAMDCQGVYAQSMQTVHRRVFQLETALPSVPCNPAYPAAAFLATGLASVLLGNRDFHVDWGAALGERLSGFAPLNALVNYLADSEHNQLRYSLNSENFLAVKIGEVNARQRERERLVARARTWETDSAIHSNFKHTGFTVMHNHIYSDETEIGQCVQAVAKNKPARARVLFDTLGKVFERPGQFIDQAWTRTGNHGRPDGSKRNDTVTNILRTRDFVQEYLRLAESDAAGKVDPRVGRFLEGLHRYLEAARQCIVDLPEETSLDAFYRLAAMRGFECLLRLYEEATSPACVITTIQRALLDLPLDADLMPELDSVDDGTSPLCRPEDVFSAVAYWAEKENQQGLVDNDKDSYLEAVDYALQRHLNKRRMLPVSYLESALPTKSPRRAEIKITYERASNALKAELQKARAQVTSAAAFDAIQPAQADEMQRNIAALSNSITDGRPLGKKNPGVLRYPDFPQAQAALQENVIRKLHGEFSKTRYKIATDVEELEAEGRVTPGDITRVRAFLREPSPANLRAADEAVLCLRNHQKLPERLKTDEHLAIRYQRTIDEIADHCGTGVGLLDAVKEALAGKRAVGEPKILAELSDEERREALAMLKDYDALFEGAHEKNLDKMQRFFKRIGVDELPTIPLHGVAGRTQRRVTILDIAPSTFDLTARPGEELFVPPEIGSEARYIRGAIVRNTPNVDALQNIAYGDNNFPVVLFARRKLSLEKRARIAAERSILIVDEASVVFAALHPGERREALIKVGVLTYSCNPFNDFGNAVPRELFFGRTKELDRIRNASGLVVLYGGRRLGKSSILHQVLRQVEQPENAVYVNYKTIERMDYRMSAWETLAGALVNAEVVPAIARPRKVQDFVNHLRKHIAESGVSRLYLLLDEVDRMMAEEIALSPGEHGFVERLGALADELRPHCDIQIVLAGLHDVARIEAERSNSIFNRAESIALRPWTEPEDIRLGQELVVKPLHALGYRFEDDAGDVPMRIMAVCNAYPALIQMYLKRLIERLENDRQSAPPPFTISTTALEEVELTRQLIDDFRAKFGASLELDKRYKAIALMLADAWHSDNEAGIQKGLNVEEVRGLCQDLVPKLFEGTAPATYHALLDEMDKLNVTQLMANGRYMLRTPNIAMMIGNQEEIDRELAKLASVMPESKRNYGERRAFFDLTDRGRQRQHELFPMPVGWLRNFMQNGRTGRPMPVIVGNDLTGIRALNGASTAVWELEGRKARLCLGHLRRRINDIRAEQAKPAGDKRPQLLFIRACDWEPAALGELAAEAARGDQYDIRVMLLAGPERIVDMANAFRAQVDAQKFDGLGWEPVVVPPWSADALYLHASNHADNPKLADNQEAIAQIIEASAGFTNGVTAIYSPTLAVNQVNAQAAAFAKKHLGSAAAIYNTIGMPKAFGEARREGLQLAVTLLTGERAQVRNGFVELDSELIDFLRESRVELTDVQVAFWMGILQQGGDGKWVVPVALRGLVDGAKGEEV
ncbi:RNaseH domain-containing protein [Microbulbifer sp.]|uniref:RNaseH domain-containing protein n=1 Tax=Microbulbifer sp. TaxID=1908541 RepID=UPI003F311779